jgi:transposase
MTTAILLFLTLGQKGNKNPCDPKWWSFAHGSVAKLQNWHCCQPKYLPPYAPDLNPIDRIWLTMKTSGFNNDVCKNEEKLLERLDQAILDVINNPKKTQKTARIGTLIWQTL